MKKKLLFAALASIVLVGCTSNDFVGDTPPAPNGSTAIAFGGGAGKITRATSNTGSVVNMLDNQFKIYGVKNAADGYTDVFQDYILWYNNSTTTSNPDADWEYVGDATQEYGTNNETIGSAQTIKYWDYSADNYHFVAGSPVANFTYNITNGDIASATVTGLAGHILPNTSGTAISDFNPVYIADPVNVPKANYKQEVTFNFRRQQTRVRVGIFETIPGYSITDIKFYQMSDANGSFSDSPRTDQYIVLNSPTAKYFVGSADATATVTYDWTTPTYTFAYTTGLTESRNFFAGKMTGVPATTSTESTANLYGTDGDMETASGYFTVMPTPSGTDAAAILIKCDYTLTADDGKGETIKITGATAAIPAAFCKWLPNVSYTYLFKISDNTNGSTGTPGTDPEGLFPITFDAVVLAEAEGTEQGTITTVSTPSITTYQEGSVTETGIKYAVGKPIYFTVQDDESGTLYPLTALDNAAPADGMVQVYVASENNTEADLVLTRPVAANSFSTTIGADAWTINGNTIAANNWASFTPTVARTYAIEYVTVTNDGPVYTYKVVKVE